MSLEKTSTIYRGEKSLGAKIVIDQVNGKIQYYNTNGNLFYSMEEDETGYNMNFYGYLGMTVFFGGTLAKFEVNAGYAEVGSIILDTNGISLDTEGNNIGIDIMDDAAFGRSKFELNSRVGVRIPRIAGNSTIARHGYMWFDTTANRMKYLDNSGAVKTITAT